MLNVMLIDDEYIILKGLQAMLNNQTDIALMVHPFLDSVKALEELETVRPDVVITDINMPELDGLTFIEKALEAGYPGRFIIISGYEKVNYLKRAISLHVVDYIIKPLDKNVLIELLTEIDIDHQKMRRMLLLKIKMALTLDHDLPDEALPLQDDFVKLIKQPYTALITTRKPDDDTIMHLSQRLETYVSTVYSLTHNELVLFLCGLTQPLSANELHSIWDAVGGDGQSAASVPGAGVSRVYPTADLHQKLHVDNELPLLLESIADWVLRMLNSAEGISVHCDSARLNYALARAILHMQQPQIAEAAFCALVKQSDNLREAFVYGFAETIAGVGTSAGLMPKRNTVLSIYREKLLIAADLQGLRDALWSLPAKCYTIDITEPKPAYSNNVEKAIMYMKNHYTEDISLRIVADEIGLSQNYLSYIFSHDVDVTFVEYLHRLRMEAACRLLQSNSTLSIAAIAERVGYQTVGHFYKIFKNTYDVSPKQWRLQNEI